MNARRITRWVFILAALCAGFGVAGRDATQAHAPPEVAIPTHPFASESLPVPTPESGTNPNAGQR